MKQFVYFCILNLLFIPVVYAQEFSLGNEDPNAVVDTAAQYAHSTLALVIFSIYVISFIVAVSFFILKKKKQWVSPTKLPSWPDSGKVIVTFALFAYALVHIFALVEVYLKTNVAFPSVSEYFFYMKLPKLVAITHAHFFGHATMYMLTSIIFLCTSLSENKKIIFIALAMGAGILDVPSWWMIKYAGPQYEIFSMFAGMMSAIGWGFMALTIFFELWFKKGAANE